MSEQQYTSVWEPPMVDGSYTTFSAGGVSAVDHQITTFKFALEERLREDKKFLPTRAEPLASGWDVRAALTTPSIEIQPNQLVMIPLGFRVFCPAGWWVELRPRSSSFAKKHLHCLYGVIDEAFEGTCMFVCQYIPPDGDGALPLTIKFGEPLGQLLPVKRNEMMVQEISNEEYDSLCRARGGERKSGGFGSTDSRGSA